MHHIYVHTNRTNGKKYIGITNDICNRWRCNGIAYKPYDGKENSRPFWNAICKYGFEAFAHEVIETVETFEDACALEKYYIALYQTTDRRKGYNVAPGGNGGKIYEEHPRGMLGKHHKEEKKIAQSILMKTLQNEGRMTWKQGHPKGMLGKHHTEEYKHRISEMMKGRVVSESTRRKIGDARRGIERSEETKKKLRTANIGKHKRCENQFAKKVSYILNGERHNFGCVEDLLDDLHISKTLFYKLVKSGEEYMPCGRAKVQYRHLKGLRVMYNTMG